MKPVRTEALRDSPEGFCQISVLCRMSFMNQHDSDILRSLATRVAELAAEPGNRKKADLWSRLTDLDTSVRPLLLTHLFPPVAWEEALPDAENLKCQDETARMYERDMRQRIWTVENINDDTVIEPVIRYPHCVTVVPFSELAAGWEYSEGDDQKAGSAKIHAVVKEKSDIEKLGEPQIHVDTEQRERYRQEAEEIFGGILDIIPTGMYFAAKVIDEWADLRGMDQLYIDVVEDPTWTHEALQRIADNFKQRFTKLEELGLWGVWDKADPLGSTGLRFNPNLPSYKEVQQRGGHVSLKESWAFTCAEAFTCVSPKMHDEFAYHYDRQLMSLFGYVNVGCCEVLSNKIRKMKSIPNLRRISISEWSDLEKAANAIGTDYVYGYKPSGVPFVGKKLDAEAVRSEIRGVLEKAGDCVLEIILNIGGSLGNDAPNKLKQWADIALEEINAHQEKH